MILQNNYSFFLCNFRGFIWDTLVSKNKFPDGEFDKQIKVGRINQSSEKKIRFDDITFSYRKIFPAIYTVIGTKRNYSGTLSKVKKKKKKMKASFFCKLKLIVNSSIYNFTPNICEICSNVIIQEGNHLGSTCMAINPKYPYMKACTV